jgi:hypothetical protein
MYNVLLAWVMLVPIVAGCIASPFSTRQATPSSIPAGNTQSVSTLTPGPTQTLVAPSPTSLPTSTVTPTVIATVLPEEVLNLFKANGGCPLPCWWGIMPGETSIEIVKSFTERFGDLAIHVLRQETGNFAIRVPDGDVRPEIDIVYGPLQGSIVEWLDVTPFLYFKNSAGEYEHSDNLFDPQLPDYFPIYTIAAILSTYGKPEAIFLSGDMTNSPGLDWTYALTLIYPKEGMRVEYFGGMTGKTTFGICPMQTSVRLWLWEPGKYTSVEEVNSSSISFQGWGTGLSEPSTLEEKTDLTIDEFYEIFKNATYDSCFESPKERWVQQP